MSYGARHSVIEVRRDRIAVFQKHKPVIILSREDKKTLPDPEVVRADCSHCGIVFDTCSIIVPRDEWIVQIGEEQRGRLAEVLGAAELEAELGASGGTDDVLIALSAARGMRRGSYRPYSASVHRERAEVYINWAEETGWNVLDLRLAAFEATRDVNVCGYALFLVFYPGGEWDLHATTDGMLTSTYTGVHLSGSGEQFNDELLHALVSICVQHISVDRVTRLTELPEELRVERATIHWEITVHGPTRDALDGVLQQMKREMAGSKIDVTWRRVEKPPAGGESSPWPEIVWAATPEIRDVRGPRRKVDRYPIVHLTKGPTGPPELRRGVVWAVVFSLFLISVTVGIRMSHSRLMQQLETTQASIAALHTQSEIVSAARSDISVVEERIVQSREFMADRYRMMSVLFALDRLLQADEYIETLFIDGEHMRMRLVAPSVVAVLTTMDTAADFDDVSMDGPVTVERVDGDRREYVTVVARVAGGATW